MLSFEEDFSAVAAQQPARAVAAALDPAQAMAAVSARAVADEPETARRVSADDKRIINGQTDVNQLVPFKYEWAWKKYLDACANHWMPQEIQMSRDIALWKDPNGLTEDERRLV
jgi:ribonucleoside-diphosphate reductase beta chain